MSKTPEMKAALEDITKALFGTSRSDQIHNRKCVTCKGEAVYFNDELSVREYNISGMCQKCQDSVFE
tara:strand:- start:562 stop:762 length:201 start_codon:yes stop_codon:yes gene_type:complete